MRGTKVLRHCARCKNPFMAREADVKRGWAKFCSKSCKAIKQEQRTGQFGNYRNSGVSREQFLADAKEYGGLPNYDRHGNYTGFQSFGFDNTEHQDHERD